MLRQTLLTVVLLASAVPAFAQVSATVRIAYFSPSRVLSESPDGKVFAARITALETERGKAIQERNAKLDQLERTVQQSASVLSEAALGQRTKELEKFRLDTQRFIEDAQAELMGVRRDAESAFLVKLRPAVERVIKDNAIQLLFNFDSGVLAWGDPSLDITDQVINQVGKETAVAK
jgi:Skp family chaperone for outer membrane proteins